MSSRRVSNLKIKEVYGIITPEIVENICDSRLLAADLLSRVGEDNTSHAAKMVLLTVDAIKTELLELIR